MKFLIVDKNNRCEEVEIKVDSLVQPSELYVTVANAFCEENIILYTKENCVIKSEYALHKYFGTDNNKLVNIRLVRDNDNDCCCSCGKKLEESDMIDQDDSESEYDDSEDNSEDDSESEYNDSEDESDTWIHKIIRNQEEIIERLKEQEEALDNGFSSAKYNLILILLGIIALQYWALMLRD